MTLTTGYRPDLEDIRSLQAGSDNRDLGQLFAASSHKPIDTAVRDAIKAKMVVENQGQTSSCAGHAGSTIMEFNRWLETGELVQLSRWAAYIWGQEVAGIRGDNGLSINGLNTSLLRRGLCAEPLWKFTGTYHTAPPGGKAALDAALASASRCKLRAWQLLKTYDEVRMWLQTGQGGIVIGIPWYDSFDRPQAGGVLPSPAGSVRGWHAVSLLWTTDKTESGKPFIEGVNSYGKTYGDQGFMSFSPSLIASLLRIQGVVFAGLSDLDGADIAPRKIDWGTARWLA